MALYRIKQFYWTLTSKISFEDKKFIELHLNDDEKNLFYKLPVSDQKHSIKVAMDIEEASTYHQYNNLMIDWNRLVRAGLLHDIGKIKKPLNFFDKSILVILDLITLGKMKRLKKLDKIYIYYYHGEEGYNLLEDFNEDKQLLYIIKNHHNENNNDDIELNILKKFDNIN